MPINKISNPKEGEQTGHSTFRSIKYFIQMKTLIIITFLVFTASYSQTKYLTKTGEISFEASVPSFEEVAATNKTVTAIINLESGELAALALVKGFRFKNALMEEHFNENYAESSTYPKATFKGQLVGYDKNELKASYTINGELTFHGVSNVIKVNNATLVKNEGSYVLTGSFTANPKDYNIEIPNIVRSKIAESVTVSFKFEMRAK